MTEPGQHWQQDRSGDEQLAPVPRDARVYVAGHRGLVGSAIWRQLEAEGFERLLGATSAELDLRDRTAVRRFFEADRPHVVVLAAAKVGGILANATYPADFLSDNLRIQINVLDAAHEHGVERLLFLGSSLHLPEVRAAADPRGRAAHRPARTDQRRLRDRQDRRRAAGAGDAPPVRAPLDLRDADQPLRARRQLRPRRTRTCCPR